jgi:hypothetical protein
MPGTEGKPFLRPYAERSVRRARAPLAAHIHLLVVLDFHPEPGPQNLIFLVFVAQPRSQLDDIA